jgi:hypothetical protein
MYMLEYSCFMDLATEDAVRFAILKVSCLKFYMKPAPFQISTMTLGFC